MDTILFDLDDTLIESMYVWSDSISALFQYLNIDMDFQRAKQTFMSMRFSEVLTYIKKYFAPKMSIEEMHAYIMHFVRQEYMYKVPEKPGARDFIRKCDEKHIQMAVLTSNDFELTRIVLDRLGILRHLKDIFSAEALHMTKREPDIYQLALDRMQADSTSTVVFEDSMYAIKTASSLGIRCIGLINDWNRSEFESKQIEAIKDFTEMKI